MNFTFTVTLGDVLMLGTMLLSAWKINRAWTEIIVEHRLMWLEYRNARGLHTRAADAED